MIGFPAGSDVALTVPFQDDAGNALVPTALNYAVSDGDGVRIVQLTPIADLSGTSTEIVIPASVHDEPGGYSLELFINVGGRVYIKEVVYGVFAVQRLIYLKNTLQTYQQAMYRARDLPNLTAFDAGARSDQELALIAAFQRLIQMNYVISWPEFPDMQSVLFPEYTSGLSPRMWPMMTPDLYERYPVQFRDAMMDAQIIEANQVLAGDVIGDKMRSGLLAWTVGESKMMFRSGVGPLQGRLSRDTMNRLTGWLNNRVTLTRL